MKSTNEAIEELRGLVAGLSSRVDELEKKKLPGVKSVKPKAKLDNKKQLRLEHRLGSYWLGRAGIVALVTGIAFFIAYSFEHFGTFVRVAIGYLLGLGLSGLGYWLARRMRTFGHLIFGGGLAVIYFTTYGLHFVASMQVIQSTTVAVVLLASLVVAIVSISHRIRSETVAGIALFLGLHTGMISEVSTFTLISSSLLAMGASFFLVKNRWVIVPASTLVAVYVNHIVWAQGAHAAGGLGISLGFLILYFVLFSLAVALAPAKLPWQASLVIPCLNWFGFISLSAYEFDAWGQDGFSWLLIVVGIALLGLAWIDDRFRKRSPAFQAYLFLGPLSLAAGLGGILSEPLMVMVWCLLSAAILLTAIELKSPVMRLAGCVILGLAVGAFLMLTSDNPLVALVVIGFLVISQRLQGRFGQPAGYGPAITVTHVSAAVLVLIVALARCMDEQLLTLGLVGGGVGLIALGGILEESWYRLGGLAVLALAFIRVFACDLSGLDEIYRISIFVSMGCVLLLISYLYTRRVRQRKSDPD